MGLGPVNFTAGFELKVIFLDDSQIVAISLNIADLLLENDVKLCCSVRCGIDFVSESIGCLRH